MPRVTLKHAMTLDGSIAAADGSSKWITSETARNDAHAFRAESTRSSSERAPCRADDPELECAVEAGTSDLSPDR